ncbi:unnamed protein product, partial [Trichogramma brassicae]
MDVHAVESRCVLAMRYNLCRGVKMCSGHASLILKNSWTIRSSLFHRGSTNTAERRSKKVVLFVQCGSATYIGVHRSIGDRQIQRKGDRKRWSYSYSADQQRTSVFIGDIATTNQFHRGSTNTAERRSKKVVLFVQCGSATYIGVHRSSRFAQRSGSSQFRATGMKRYYR